MPGMTLEEVQATNPPADRDAYEQARAAALLVGGLAELVYAMRHRVGLTQVELARRMGASQSSIARIEGGATGPTIEARSAGMRDGHPRAPCRCRTWRHRNRRNLTNCNRLPGAAPSSVLITAPSRRSRSASSQFHQIAFRAGPDAWFEVLRCDQVDLRVEDALQFCLQTRQVEQAHVLRQVHEQVNVAVSAIFAARRASEDAQSGYTVSGGGRNHVLPSAA